MIQCLYSLLYYIEAIMASYLAMYGDHHEESALLKWRLACLRDDLLKLRRDWPHISRQEQNNRMHRATVALTKLRNEKHFVAARQAQRRSFEHHFHVK